MFHFYILERFMKRYLLLLGLALAVVSTTLYAQGIGKHDQDELLRISRNGEPPTFGPDASSFPRPFAEAANPIEQAGISTGYYFVDSDDDAPDFWRPSPEIVDTTTEAAMWRRIVPGPRILPRTYWTENPSEGMRFFRNPASGDFFDHDNNAIDSSDDAIAGPIPIGFAFYFNGLRFDSFYVSTNGLIALTNRRYFYDANGNRTVPGGATSAYDPMAIEWFETFRNRTYADNPADDLTGPGTGDALGDDYGYQYVVLGNAPTNATAGIRMRGTNLNSLPYRAHVIAPFWGDGHLSQYLPATNSPEDWGKVYFKRSLAADKLIIYFVNYVLKGTLNSPVGAKGVAAHKRRGELDYIGSNCQVILNRLDSSVTIVYESFDGNLAVSGRNIPAATIFRYNSTVGVAGFARHVNYRRPVPLATTDASYPWAGEYRQYTHYYARFADPNVGYPHPYLAIRFKQWQNTLRVVDITYRTRKLDPNAGLEFTETVKSADVADYELLAGEERIGAIQPIAIIQNLTNEIQGPSGVNFIHQGRFGFRARFRIVNEANQKIIYNRLVPVDSTCLILSDSLTHLCTGDPDVKVRYVTVEIKSGAVTATNAKFPRVDSALVGGAWRRTTYGGIPPYGFAQIYFPPFAPNEFLDNQIGRMRAFIIADPTDPKNNESLGDQWPFDDTTNVRLYVMKRLDEFYDDVTEFHIIDRVPMPSVLKWVNIEGEVAPGDEISNHPLPPIGEFSAANNPNFKLNSPVIRLNRLTLQRAEPQSPKTGDELRSFPIDMRGRHKSVLSFSIQRMHKQDDWPRGWCDQQLVGPEPRAVINGAVLTPWTVARSASARPDWIAVEFAKPSPDGIKEVTNIPSKNWQDHPRRGGAKTVTNMPAFALYGAGGFLRGFLETDPDSALDAPSTTVLNGLRPNLYDDGIDFEFNKFFIQIPDTFINAPAEGAKNFRFRIRVDATNDRKCITCIPDDDDPFYVDNIKILFPPEITDIEVSAVKIHWPYTHAPASQATEIPIAAKVSNNTSIDAPRFQVKVNIFRGTFQGRQSWQWPIYCRTVPVTNLTAGKEVTVQLPTWNARETGPGAYTLQAIVVVNEGDLDQRNDTTYHEVRLLFGDSFAYDPVNNPRNDVPDQAFTGIPGRGLNLFGFAHGGFGNRSNIVAPLYAIDHAAGWTGGSGSGQIAMKFQLASTDTIYGFQAYYGLANQAFDDISFAVYTDVGGRQPGQMIQQSLIFRQRMWDDVKNEMILNDYTTYLLPRPLVLNRGTYWAVIGQMGQTGLELAASKTRVGMRTTSIYIPPPGNTSDGGTYPLGAAGIHLNIEKTFRRLSTARNLVNDNFFCFENTRLNDQWTEFSPATGNPGYAHLEHYGLSPADAFTYTLSRATWIPMLRPYFKTRSYESKNVGQWCPDDVPVNLVDFDGEVRQTGINLYWRTATEENNAGFKIERKVYGSQDDYNTIGFIKGAGTSNVINSYEFFDTDVKFNTTYQYRLRQVDFDGTETCPTEEVVTLTFDRAGVLTLEQNSPNPFNGSTKITFNLPTSTNAKLEILDIYGNVVKVLVNQELGASRHEYMWDGADSFGTPVATGTYLYRLTTNENTLTQKMSLVR